MGPICNDKHCIVIYPANMNSMKSLVSVPGKGISTNTAKMLLKYISYAIFKKSKITK